MIERKASDIINSTVGRRIKKSKGNTFGWMRNLKRGEVKFDRPVMLFLPGNAAYNDRSANANVKDIINAMGRIGVSDNDIQILSAYYPSDDDGWNRNTVETMKYLKTKNEGIMERYKDPDYVKDIYNAIIAPVLVNANGRNRDTDVIAKKFRNLTIVSHCYGSVVTRLLLDKIHNDMKHRGFSEAEIDKCIGELVCIAISPRKGYFSDKNNKAITIGFTAADDMGDDENLEVFNEWKYFNTTQFLPMNCSTMGVGLIKDEESKKYLYLCGDRYNYVDGQPIDATRGFGHNIEDYTIQGILIDYLGVKSNEDHHTKIGKNDNGKNYSRLVCKIIQNAISLSVMGEKRNIENIVSNDTPIKFKQGSEEDNPDALDLKFDGNNEVFEKTYNLQKKKVEDRMFSDGKKQLQEQTMSIDDIERTIKSLIGRE